MKVAKKIFFIVLMIWILLAVKSSAQTATVSVEAAVLREEASTSSDALAEIYEGDSLEILDKVDNWYKVKIDDKEGFVREDLLNVKEEVAETPVETETKAEESETENKQETTEQENPEKTDKTEETKKETENKETKKEEEKKINPLGEKQVTADVYCRIVPNLSSSKLDKLVAGTKVTVIKVLNSWSCVKYNSNKAAWIPTKLLKEIASEEANANVAEKETEQENKTTSWTGYISVSEAIIRGGPSTDDEIIAEVTRNTTVEIIGEDGDWYKILFNENEAYIAKRLVSDSVTAESASRNLANRINETDIEEAIQEEPEPVAQEEPQVEEVIEENEIENETSVVYEEPEPEEVVVEEPQVEAPPASSRGEEVVATAKGYLGYDYVYGGSGPYSFDCSGFTMYIFGLYGVELGHGATMQSNEGYYVSRSDLMPGDIVIFRDWDNEDIGHCGIYIGGGEFIHAANPSRGVVIDTLDSGYYYERYICGRRVL